MAGEVFDLSASEAAAPVARDFSLPAWAAAQKISELPVIHPERAVSAIAEGFTLELLQWPANLATGQLPASPV
jgi:hypothetical protein